MTPNTDQWEEELKNVYYADFDVVGFAAIDTVYEDVRDYIRSLLARRDREVVERIEGMRKNENPNTVLGSLLDWNRAYNQALSDVIALLTPKKEV